MTNQHTLYKSECSSVMFLGELYESTLCQIGPRQIGPLKKSALGKSIEYIDLHKAFDLVVKDIFQQH